MRQGDTWNETWYANPGIRGIIVGYKTPITITGETPIKVTGGGNVTGGVLSSCGKVTTLDANNNDYTGRNAVPSEYSCGGWIYSECYKDTDPTGNCSECYN